MNFQADIRKQRWGCQVVEEEEGGEENPPGAYQPALAAATVVRGDPMPLLCRGWTNLGREMAPPAGTLQKKNC